MCVAFVINICKTHNKQTVQIQFVLTDFLIKSLNLYNLLPVQAGRMKKLNRYTVKLSDH